MKSNSIISIMEKQRKDEEEDEDRISQLPPSLLHHILCYGLSQKEAVQTCVLSKSWRHLGPTRPKIEFRDQEWFSTGDEEEKYLEKTLQRYHQQKLSIQEFIILGVKEGSESYSLLQEWVPIALQNMGVNKFHLTFDSSFSKKSFNRLPSSFVLSKAEFLKELCVEYCKIDLLVDEKVHWKHLRKLTLKTVYITDATLEKIISSCPLIEYLFMQSCEGLRTIKLTKAPNLKLVDFSTSRLGDSRSIEISDAPSIESIAIADCPNWIHHPKKMYFPRLKSLWLHRVRLSNESIEFFSTSLPCLEKLTLCYFSDSEQFKLSSRSIKHLTIEVEGSSLKAAIIDVPNILCFSFSCEFLPSISFTTISTEWKSKIFFVVHTYDFDNGSWSWSHRLSEICKALSTSQISLDIFGIPPVTCGGDVIVYQPIVIENMCLLWADKYSSVPDFLNCLFRNFRPRNIQQNWFADHNRGYHEAEHQLCELLCKILLSRSERAQYFGLQNLEDVKMEASYENEEEWRGVEGPSSLSEFALPWDTLKIRFRLKWRVE